MMKNSIKRKRRIVENKENDIGTSEETNGSDQIPEVKRGKCTPLKEIIEGKTVIDFEDITATKSQNNKNNSFQSYESQLVALMRTKPKPGIGRGNCNQKTADQPVKILPSINLKQLPVDWSVKSSVCFTSRSPFTEFLNCSLSYNNNAAEITEPLNLFNQGNCDQFKDIWSKGMLTWKHPEFSLPSTTISLLRSESCALIKKRQLAWQEAFQSLYYLMRNGACEGFYVIYPEECKNAFVAFFGAKGTASASSVYVLLSRSTKNLRSYFRSAEVDLQYSMPFVKHDKENNLEESCAKNEDISLDKNSKSMLTFEGAAQVHGVFNWLLDSIYEDLYDRNDVPLLLSPKAFANSTLHKLTPKFLPPITSPNDPHNILFKLEINDWIPPWTLYYLCQTLEKTQGSSLKVYTVTEPLTCNLNVREAKCGSISKAYENLDFNWSSAHSDLYGYYLRDISCIDGKCAIRIINAL